jgi:hypothetical protein
MRLVLTIIAGTLLWSSCKDEKKPGAGGEPQAVNDFIERFAEVPLPFTVKDSVLMAKDDAKAPNAITAAAFSRFIPDSVLTTVFGKNARPALYTLARAGGKNDKGYCLLVKAVTAGRKAVFLLCFDKDQQYKCAMPVLSDDADPTTAHYCRLEKNLSVTMARQQKKADQVMDEQRKVYAFDENIGLVLVMADPGADLTNTVVQNPIDTFPRKNKLAGDYGADKKNFVSIRDGKSPTELLFFIHFEKKEGACTGELKGNATLAAKDSAVFKLDGDPCELALLFRGSNVMLKELRGCGSHRGIECAFEGSYTRIKEVPKPKEPARPGKATPPAAPKK